MTTISNTETIISDSVNNIKEQFEKYFNLIGLQNTLDDFKRTNQMENYKAVVKKQNFSHPSGRIYNYKKVMTTIDEKKSVLEHFIKKDIKYLKNNCYVMFDSDWIIQYFGKGNSEEVSKWVMYIRDLYINFTLLD